MLRGADPLAHQPNRPIDVIERNLNEEVLEPDDAQLLAVRVVRKGLDDVRSCVHELAVEVLAAMPADEYPHFVAFAREHVLQPDYDFSAEFDVGLGFVLDSIAGLPSAPRARRKGHR